MSIKALNSQNINELRNLKNSGDRGGFYYRYFELTGSNQALIQAQITTYSGIFGGLAINGNILAKDNNPKLYNIALDTFSRDILEANFNAIENNIKRGGTGILSDDQLQDIDRSVWNDKGMGKWFPGNYQLLDNSISSFFGNLFTPTVFGLPYYGTNIAYSALFTGKRPTDFIDLNDYLEKRSYNISQSRYEYQNDKYSVVDKVVNNKKIFIIFDRSNNQIKLILDKDAESSVGNNNSLLNLSWSKDEAKFSDFFEKKMNLDNAGKNISVQV